MSTQPQTPDRPLPQYPPMPYHMPYPLQAAPSPWPLVTLGFLMLILAFAGYVYIQARIEAVIEKTKTGAVGLSDEQRSRLESIPALTLKIDTVNNGVQQLTGTVNQFSNLQMQLQTTQQEMGNMKRSLSELVVTVNRSTEALLKAGESAQKLEELNLNMNQVVTRVNTLQKIAANLQGEMRNIKTSQQQEPDSNTIQLGNRAAPASNIQQADASIFPKP